MEVTDALHLKESLKRKKKELDHDHVDIGVTHVSILFKMLQPKGCQYWKSVDGMMKRRGIEVLFLLLATYE